MSQSERCKYCGNRMIEPLFADFRTLAHYTELEKELLKEILNDSRVKKYERRSGFKRVWMHEPALKAIYKIKGEYN